MARVNKKQGDHGEYFLPTWKTGVAGIIFSFLTLYANTHTNRCGKPPPYIILVTQAITHNILLPPLLSLVHIHTILYPQKKIANELIFFILIPGHAENKNYLDTIICTYIYIYTHKLSYTYILCTRLTVVDVQCNTDDYPD